MFLNSLLASINLFMIIFKSEIVIKLLNLINKFSLIYLTFIVSFVIL